MGKKEKKVKAKFIYFKPNIYSEKYESLFSSGKYTDITLTVGNDTYKLHKNILASSSDYFKDNIKENELNIEEKDSKNFKKYLQFLYTGAVDMANEEELYDFLFLALKYKTKNLNEFQIPSKKILVKLIEFAEKDNNNVTTFETLLSSINLKKIDEDVLSKLAKKSKDKWLSKNSVWKKKIKALENESDSEKDSDEDSDEESEEDSDSDEETGGSLPQLDLKLSNNFSYDKKTKYIKCNTSSWMTAIAKKPATKFTIELGINNSSLMIGFIQKERFNQNSSNYNNGHCWYATSSGLYGNNKFNNNSSLSGGGSSNGTKYGAVFDKKKGTISFYKDGVFLSIGFDNLKDKKIKFYPQIDCCTNGATFKYIKGKYKKK